MKAKRVVLDTIEALFGRLSDQGIIRAEWRATRGRKESAINDHEGK